MKTIKFILFISILFNLGCQTESDQLDSIKSSYKYVVVLRDQGCIKCNRKIAQVCSENLNNPNVAYVLCATGLRYDIAKLYHSERKNVFNIGSDKFIHHFKEKASYLIIEDEYIPITPSTVEYVVKLLIDPA